MLAKWHFIIVVACSMGFLSCDTGGGANGGPVKQEDPPIAKPNCLTASAEACELQELINNSRRSYGLDVLPMEERCQAMAADQSKDMAEYEYLNSDRPEVPGRPAQPFYKRWMSYGFSSEIVSELVLISNDEPLYTRDSWMQSQAAVQSILNPLLKGMGVGHSKSKYGDSYWALCLFGESEQQD